MSIRLTRREYASLHGMTVGDKIHLGETGLFAEIEKDYRGKRAGKPGPLDICVQ